MNDGTIGPGHMDRAAVLAAGARCCAGSARAAGAPAETPPAPLVHASRST